MTKEFTKEQIEEKKNNGWYKHSIDKECAFYQSNIYQWIDYHGWLSYLPYEVSYWNGKDRIVRSFATLKEAKEYAKTCPKKSA